MHGAQLYPYASGDGLLEEETHHCRPFALQRGRLCRDHLQIARGSRLVLSRGYGQRPVGCLHRLVLSACLVFENPQRRQIIFDLLEGCKHGLTVAGDGFIVGGDELIHRGAAQSGIEERLRERSADRPKPARPGE